MDNIINGSSILITGGTGSFGQRLVSAILSRYSPRRLVIFSRDELKQYEMRRRFQADCVRFFIGDIRDQARLARALEGVDYVVHAAALKQVPALEYNPSEAIKTNILGAENLIQAALDKGVRKVVALSTDKAVNPINLYGATKLAADKLFVAANNIKGGRDTIFSIVRYGNVLGSRGSVVPLFRKLVSEGAAKLPVTDTRMTRFSITLDEGVAFVLKSLARMHGGEIMVPRIPSLRITDVVEALVGAGNYTVTGIRVGEKLHELLIPRDLAGQTIEFDDFFLVQPDPFFHEGVRFDVTRLGEQGRSVAAEFEYSSDSNPWFLSAQEIASQVEGI